MGKGFLDILMWTIVAALAVLIIMNAGNVAGLIMTFGSFWTKETGILTGSGYQNGNAFTSSMKPAGY